jgi:hypothetical protein
MKEHRFNPNRAPTQAPCLSLLRSIFSLPVVLAPAAALARRPRRHARCPCRPVRPPDRRPHPRSPGTMSDASVGSRAHRIFGRHVSSRRIPGPPPPNADATSPPRRVHAPGRIPVTSIRAAGRHPPRRVHAPSRPPAPRGPD